jgi:hypothetical protein
MIPGVGVRLQTSRLERRLCNTIGYHSLHQMKAHQCDEIVSHNQQT